MINRSRDRRGLFRILAEGGPMRQDSSRGKISPTIAPGLARSDLGTADFDLTRVTTPILLHLLRRELRFPRLFLLGCRLTPGGFMRRIDSRFPKELVDLAAMPLWVILNLKRRIGQRRAFEIMRVALLTGGVASWNLAYKAAEPERSFANLC